MPEIEQRRNICQACPALARDGDRLWCPAWDDNRTAWQNCPQSKHARWQARVVRPEPTCGKWHASWTRGAGCPPCPVCDAPDPIQGPEDRTRPEGWWREAAEEQRHLAAFAEVCRRDYQPPENLHGDGIVTCLYGDTRFWPQIVVQVKLARSLGIRLPIFVFHDVGVGRELDGLCTLVDVRQFGHAFRKYDHWALKTFAIAHSGLARVLFLDGDAYLVADPSPLFALLEQYAFVYWENLEGFNVLDEKLIAPLGIASMPRRVQGGHYLIDLREAWRELMVAIHYNNHADFWWRRNTSDDEAGWRLTLGALGTRYLCLDFDWQYPAFICRGPGAPGAPGTPYIVHRPQSKLYGHKITTAYPHLPREGEVMAILHAEFPASVSGPPETQAQRISRRRRDRRRALGLIAPK
jgi:hypothetical protein